ncbi:hypothetical protein HDU98_007551 [Podochytrium sp. JEL0797]|nr:hypothetical protein HDU98_007551 [Podochytrium sp. JEL0797]
MMKNILDEVKRLTGIIDEMALETLRALQQKLKRDQNRHQKEKEELAFRIDDLGRRLRRAEKDLEDAKETALKSITHIIQLEHDNKKLHETTSQKLKQKDAELQCIQQKHETEICKLRASLSSLSFTHTKASFRYDAIICDLRAQITQGKEKILTLNAGQVKTNVVWKVESEPRNVKKETVVGSAEDTFTKIANTGQMKTNAVLQLESEPRNMKKETVVRSAEDSATKIAFQVDEYYPPLGLAEKGRKDANETEMKSTTHPPELKEKLHATTLQDLKQKKRPSGNSLKPPERVGVSSTLQHCTYVRENMVDEEDDGCEVVEDSAEESKNTVQIPEQQSFWEKIPIFKAIVKLSGKSAKQITPKQEEKQRRKDAKSFLRDPAKLPSEFRSKYKLLNEFLGEGAFGFVMVALRLEDGMKVAIKFITSEKIPRDCWVPNPVNLGELVPVEVARLQEVNHPNIIKYISHMKTDKYFIFITELHGTEWAPAPAPRKVLTWHSFFKKASEIKHSSFDLFECIDAHHGRLPEEPAKQICAQISLAIKHLHDRGLVHRDIKDSNVVVNSNFDVKLIDFGAVAPIPKNLWGYFQASQFRGTMQYASPEILNGSWYCGRAAEIW